MFAGRVCVVTGSTQGLGEAIARLFAAEGAAGLVICGRDVARGAAVAASLPTAIFVQADLADADAPAHIMAEAEARFGRVDVLVNSGASTERGTILDTTAAMFDRMMAINVRAPFLLIQAAARLMRDAGRGDAERGGTVVNIQSMSAHGGQSFLSAYSISKGALSTLTKNAAYALMPDRIRVNGLNIGWMDTPGEAQIQARAHEAPADWLARAEAKQPFGRLLKPDEVARAVAYLASDASGMMTGSVIDFDQQVRGAGDAPSHPLGRLPD